MAIHERETYVTPENLQVGSIYLIPIREGNITIGEIPVVFEGRFTTLDEARRFRVDVGGYKIRYACERVDKSRHLDADNTVTPIGTESGIASTFITWKTPPNDYEAPKRIEINWSSLKVTNYPYD